MLFFGGVYFVFKHTCTIIFACFSQHQPQNTSIPLYSQTINSRAHTHTIVSLCLLKKEISVLSSEGCWGRKRNRSTLYNVTSICTSALAYFGNTTPLLAQVLPIIALSALLQIKDWIIQTNTRDFTGGWLLQRRTLTMFAFSCFGELFYLCFASRRHNYSFVCWRYSNWKTFKFKIV